VRRALLTPVPTKVGNYEKEKKKYTRMKLDRRGGKTHANRNRSGTDRRREKEELDRNHWKNSAGGTGQLKGRKVVCTSRLSNFAIWGEK